MAHDGSCNWLWCTVVLCFASLPATSGTRTAAIDGDVVLVAIFSVHQRSAPDNDTVPSQEQYGRISEKGIRSVEMFFYSLDLLNRYSYILRNTRLGGVVIDSQSSVNGAVPTLEMLGDAVTLIAGVIGPDSPTQIKPAQNVLKRHKIPQITYVDRGSYLGLSDTSEYPSLVSLLPSNKQHAKALLALLVEFSWSYISVVTSTGADWLDLKNELERLLMDNGICVAMQANESHIDSIAERLAAESRVRVVVCLCDDRTVRQLLLAIKRGGMEGRFVVVGTTDWVRQPAVVSGVEDAAAGGLSVSLSYESVTRFDDYFRSLRPETNHRNPWFREYWEEKFSCRLPGMPSDSAHSRDCTGGEHITTDFEESPDYILINKAVNAMALGLARMESPECGRKRLCDVTSVANRERLLSNIKQVLQMAENSPGSTWFDENGEPMANYAILNYQRTADDTGTGSYRHVLVGTWTNDRLTVETSQIQWPVESMGEGLEAPQSVCSQPCSQGYVRVTTHGWCCWICVPCATGKTNVDDYTCGGG